MKSRSLYIILFFILSIVTTGRSQNSFQKLILTDSLGFFGLTMQQDSTYLLGIQTPTSCKIVKIDRFGTPLKATILEDSATIYLQQMTSLKDGGALLTGSRDGSAFVVKIDSALEVVWSRQKKPGFGTGASFYFASAEDSMGNIALLENREGNFTLCCLSPSGQWLWSRKTLSTQEINLLKRDKDGGFNVSGSTTGNSYLWKISAEGVTKKTLKFSLPAYSPMLVDVIEFQDSTRIFLFQYTVNYKSFFILAYVLPDSFIQYAYAAGSEFDFRFISNLFLTGPQQISIMGNVYQAGTGPIFSHPYHILRADFTMAGQLISARQFLADHLITGLSQAILTPDQGILACGFACDSLSFPYFPYLLKTDMDGFVNCFSEEVSLDISPYMLNLQEIDEQLTSVEDSLQNINIQSQALSVPAFTTLCYTGINEKEEPPIPLLFPNPAESYISIDLSTMNQTVENIQLFNMQGQLLKSLRPGAALGIIDIAVAGLDPGCYFIRLTSGHGVIYNRFIKK